MSNVHTYAQTHTHTHNDGTFAEAAGGPGSFGSVWACQTVLTHTGLKMSFFIPQGFRLFHHKWQSSNWNLCWQKSNVFKSASPLHFLPFVSPKSNASSTNPSWSKASAPTTGQRSEEWKKTKQTKNKKHLEDKNSKSKVEKNPQLTHGKPKKY